jgi:hypothetical protein
MAETGGLLPALLAVQAEAPTLPKSGFNPHYKSRFTPLDDIVERIGPLLHKNGLVWTTWPSIADGQPSLKYKIAHAPSGEAEEGEMLLLGKQDAQGQGGAITYARRYALCAVLNLVADEDVDGNTPQGQQQASEPPPPKLTDDKAKRLIAEAEKLHSDIAEIDPSRVPQAKFEAWLRSAWHDHDRLSALNEHLAGEWATMQVPSEELER